MARIPRVLSIAGTDPTGGAGIQADLKSIAAAGGYGMCVVTALVAQNTQGVREIHTPPQSFLRAQLDSVFDDVTVDAVKIGMLGDADTTRTVSEFLAHPSSQRFATTPPPPHSTKRFPRVVDTQQMRTCPSWSKAGTSPATTPPTR